MPSVSGTSHELLVLDHRAHVLARSLAKSSPRAQFSMSGLIFRRPRADIDGSRREHHNVFGECNPPHRHIACDRGAQHLRALQHACSDISGGKANAASHNDLQQIVRPAPSQSQLSSIEEGMKER